MRMQEPEQWQPSRQEGQASQEYGEYRAQYAERDEPEQQQKIYPQEEQRLHGRAPGLLAIIILSSIGFFFTVAGIVASAIVLNYANGQQEMLAGGVIGLVGSIGGMLMCVAIFVIAVVALARPHVMRASSRP
ncbi:MAG: hypothetical protein ACJ8CB_13915 [Ktedonobacteraceae bacterium]